MKDIVREALVNNWEDRCYMHYVNLIDPNASRPRDEYTQEWQDIIKALWNYVGEVEVEAELPPIEVPKKKAIPKTEELVIEELKEEEI